MNWRNGRTTAAEAYLYLSELAVHPRFFRYHQHPPTMARLAARRADSVDSGPGIVRAASQDTNPFYDRSTSVASSSAQSGSWSRTPTVVPIPGQKLSRTQKRSLKRKNKALEKEKEREAKKESYQLPMIKEEGALPGPPTEGRFKAQKGDRFERCYPVRTSVARCTGHTD